MKITTIFKILVCIILLATPIITNANDLNDGNGDVDDTTVAPISDYAPVLTLLAVTIAYRTFRKKPIT